MRKMTAWVFGVAAVLVGPAASGDMVSFGTTRSGSTYRGTNSPGGPVYAMAPYTPLFLVQGGSNIHRGFMVFDLSAVPSGATITSVRFEFTQEASGSPTMQILGDYQSGELAYDTYFNFNNHAHPGIQVSSNDAPFTSMTTDGSLFGSSVLDGPYGQTRSIDLASNGAVSYFQSQIGGQVLLFAHLLNDLTGPGGSHGSDRGGYPTLRIEYDTFVVPAPSASLLACIGLAGLVAARRRITA